MDLILRNNLKSLLFLILSIILLIHDSQTLLLKDVVSYAS